MRSLQSSPPMLAVVLLSALGAGALVACRPHGSGGSVSTAVQYFCPMHPQIVRDQPGDCPVCGMKLEKRMSGPAAGPPAASSAPRRIAYYRHPMNPAVHSEHPAKDEMGMDYVPVYEDESQTESQVPGRATVTLPPDRLRLLGIRSEPITIEGMPGGLRTVGRVTVDERGREVVHAKYEGYVEKLLVDFTGQQVAKGQPLLDIYSPELVAAQQEYLVALRAQERLSGSTVPDVARGGGELAAAARQRLAYWDMSPTQIAALEKSGSPSRRVTVYSPVSGVVTEKLAFEGMRVSPAERLYEIADLSRVWVLAQIFEKDLPAVRVGMTVRVAVRDQPGKEWRGTVAFVSPTVMPDTRTAEARVELPNPGGTLKPDMFADVVLEGSGTPTLTVPETAVIFTGERSLVFVDLGSGRFEPREVGVGARTTSGYAVLSGLTAGERVVVSANFLLDSESSLRAAISSAEREH